jgi:hypothetical protein
MVQQSLCRPGQQSLYRPVQQSLYRPVQQSVYRPGQALRVPGVVAPRFHDNRHMNVVKLSALRTGRL